MNSLTISDIEVGQDLPVFDTDMTAQKIIAAAAATRDWQPIHHDYEFATEKSGLRNIILNAPSQAGWISSYITDWAGAQARIKSLGFKMKDSICPGDALQMSGRVLETEDAGKCGSWVVVEVLLQVGEKLKTKAEVKLAVPGEADGQNKRAMPWHCPQEAWMAS